MDITHCISDKKDGKIRVCVDLKKVNAATMRIHNPLPFTKHVLERVVGHKAYSFLDGFSGYNQVSIDPKDQHMIAFATTWSVFCISKNVIWMNQHPTNISKTDEYNLQGILVYMARNLSRRFMHILTLVGTSQVLVNGFGPLPIV